MDKALFSVRAGWLVMLLLVFLRPHWEATFEGHIFQLSSLNSKRFEWEITGNQTGYSGVF